ncbi:MAG: RNA 2',3'-cyclic phosphodiesterase [Proteobacteria bacterium]|nr:RNA 2',3'-cyclic phosphodiesterase [Pseudomonadota bacterium]
MIRLFVGIPLPQPIRDRLAGLCAGVPGARWVAPDNLHLTLRFIGEVDPPTADELDGALAGIAAPGFEISLVGVDCFQSNRQPPRVLWAGVEREPRLQHLYDKIESALVRAGLPPEGRKFRPHVTLARLRDAPGPRIGAWMHEHGLFRAGPVPVEAFVLYSSHPGADGSVYVEEAVYPLRAAPSQ